jgi:predicted ATPase
VTTRDLLIVVDNCEHVLHGSTTAIDALLQAAPGISVLATSREALGVAGEKRHQVPPLLLRDGNGSPALDLLVARAAAVQARFSPDQDDEEALAEICLSLEGMPLAIELAAAQLAFLSPGELLESLAERLSMSGGTGREHRHRTLQATMEWSWELLNDDERRLLAELSVFAGGWTLLAARSVCSGGPREIREGLGSLVGKSLVIVETNVWGARYRLLETIRIFAKERLSEGSAEMSSRHAAWYAHLVRFIHRGGPLDLG